MLESQRAELERQGYRVVATLADGFVASRSKWYWDCMMVKLSTLVLVRRVAAVEVPDVTADFASLESNARSYDPSALPRGFQKGRALVLFYVADQVSAAAASLARTRPKVEFGSVSMVGMLDGAGQAHYFRETPIWGAVFFPKLRFLVERLISPTAPPSSEPLSTFGVVYAGCMVFLLLSLVACLVGVLMCLLSPVLAQLGSV